MSNRSMRNPAVASLVAAVFLVAAALARAAAADDQGVAGTVFADPVNGLRLALEVRPTTWHPGEAIAFICTVKNVSDKPIRVAAWGLDLAQAIEITDAAGNVFPNDGGRDATRRVTPEDFATIPPGESKRFTLNGRLTDTKMLIVHELLGGIWHWSLADGDYTVRAVFDRRANDEWLKRQAAGETWTGRAFSPPVKVTVGPKAPRPGEPVDGLKLTLTADRTELKMTPRNLRRATKDTPRWNVEPVKLTFTFTNVSDKPVKLNAYDLTWSLLKLDVRGPDDESVRAVQLMVERMMAAPTKDDYPTIAPGGNWTSPWPPGFPGRFGALSYILLKPGDYRITAAYTCTERHLGLSEHAKGSWTGLVTSNEIVLKASLEAGK